MRAIDNAPRGCGTLKKGGSYLTGAPVPGGTLAAFSWVLGEQVEGGRQVYYNTPVRGMTRFNPQATLTCEELAPSRNRINHYGQVIYDTSTTLGIPKGMEHLGVVPTVGLLDHVGASHYTPFSFAMECRARGPSRKVTHEFAAKVAEMELPILICFTGKMPVFRDEIDARMMWAKMLREHEILAPAAELKDYDFRATWYMGSWGVQVWNDTGWRHYAVRVLKNLDGEGRHLSEEIHRFHEQWFGCSWITEAVYVCRDGERELPDNLKGSRVIPVIAEDNNEAIEL